MPFLHAVNNITNNINDIQSNQISPLSVEGLNENNFKGGFKLEPSATTSEEQKYRLDTVNSSLNITKKNTEKVLLTQNAANTYGLVMPSIELIPKQKDQLSVLEQQVLLLVVTKIWDCVVSNNLYYFYTIPTQNEQLEKCSPKTPQQRLQEVVNRATIHDYQILMELYGITSIDHATDLSVLALYDIIELIDDSTSMRYTGYKNFLGYEDKVTDFDPEEINLITGEDNNNLSRWDKVIKLIKITSYTTTLFDSDGISLRFFNKNHLQIPSDNGVSLCDNVSSPQLIDKLFTLYKNEDGKNTPQGGTNIGSCIKKTFDEIVQKSLKTQTLSKPVLVLIYTDGASNDLIIPVIREIRKEFNQTKYGSRGMVFSFNQIGNDDVARRMLETLDTDSDDKNPNIGAGPIVDCTSVFKIEKIEYDRAQNKLPKELKTPYTPAFHIIKGLVGPIMEKYDKADEV